MNYLMRNILHLSLLALSAYGFSDPGTLAPQTEKMEPRVGRPGTIIKITGKALGKNHVDEVYLTDHRFDMKVKVLDQSETQITVRVPPFVKPGRLQLLLLTAGSRPVYLEQPWFLQVESDEEIPPPAEISQKSKPTVEVAATGTSIPVPMAGAPPSPATSPSLEKSIVPLKAVEPAKLVGPETQATPGAPAPAPVTVPQTASGVNPANIPAQIVRRTRVTYPASAAAQKIEGTVELVAIVRIDGRVKEIRIVKGNPFLVGAAINSVRDWLYEPAYLQGKPVESEVPVTLNFKRP